MDMLCGMHGSRAIAATAATVLCLAHATLVHAQPPYQVPTRAYPRLLLAVDVNHDAGVDLLTASFNSPICGTSCSASTISLQLGAGDGTFGSPIEFPVGLTTVRRLESVDVNGDSHPDVVAIHRKTISVLLGTGSGAFLAPKLSSRPDDSYWFSSLAIGDVTGDGNLDVVAGTHYAAHCCDVGSYEIWVGNGSGNFVYARTVANHAGGVEDVHLKDMNGDGILDIVASGNGYPVGGVLHVLLGTGVGMFASNAVYNNNGGPVAVADFDRDGHLDVLHSRRFYRGSATGQLGSPTPSVACADVADFNVDGYADCYAIAGDSVIVTFGDGAGGFSQSYPYEMGAGILGGGFMTPVWAVRAAHLNGNGIPDLVTGHLGGFLTILLDPSSLVDVPEPPPSRVGFALAGHPNPARSRVVLEVDAARRAPLTLHIYDLAGRQVRTLHDPTATLGRRAVVWDLADGEGVRVPAGVYLCVTSDGERVARGRVVVLD